MYQLTVPGLIRNIRNLQALMTKGQEHAAAHELDEKSLIEFRLYPDMLPLRWQVYIATDTAKFAMIRLGELEAPTFDDTEATFEELDARLGKTLAYLETVKPEQIDGTEAKEVVMKRRGTEHRMNGQDYVLGYVLPQVYFHTTTAYLILRHNGVKLEKADFLRA